MTAVYIYPHVKALSTNSEVMFVQEKIWIIDHVHLVINAQLMFLYIVGISSLKGARTPLQPIENSMEPIENSMPLFRSTPKATGEE